MKNSSSHHPVKPALPGSVISPILWFMEASQFEEANFFGAIASSSARAMLIGRRALIALGLPLLTRDYDFWVPVNNVRVAFDDVWSRRRVIEVSDGVKAAIPSLDDLILTKRFAARPKDAEDIRMLEALRSEEHK